MKLGLSLPILVLVAWSTVLGPAAAQLTGAPQESEAAQEYVRRLLEPRDPAVIPELVELLERDDQYLQKAICMGLLETFSSRQALEALAPIAKNGSSISKRAAVHVLGHYKGPASDVLPLLVGALSDSDPEARKAAVYAMSQLVYFSHFAAQMAIMGKEDVTMPKDRAERQDLLTVLMELVQGSQTWPSKEALQILRLIADHDTARTLVELYASRLEPGSRELGDLLVRMQHVNRRWLGRPVPAPAKKISYQLSRTHFDRPMPVHRLTVTHAEQAVLRAKGHHFDRAQRLVLPLDALLTIPALKDLELLPSEAGAPRTRTLAYGVEPNDFDVGLGLMGSYSFKIPNVDANRAVVRVDAERAVPLDQELQLPDGTVWARSRYEDYVDAGDGALVPARIVVEIPSYYIADKVRHLRYTFSFAVTQGVWHFTEGVVHDLGPDGEERIAASRLFNLQITPLDDAPQEGLSTGSSAGQGALEGRSSR